MVLEDIYRDPLLKYPLSEEEYTEVFDVWEFLQVFKKAEIFVTDYRNKLIKDIRARYSPEQFYMYEQILNKMFWNLRWLLYPLWDNPDRSNQDYIKFIKNGYNGQDKIPYSLLLCSYEPYTDNNDLDKKLANNPVFHTVFYRSFINKIVIVDKKSKTIMTKPFEGSAHIFGKNYFNLMTMAILFDKPLYEQVMKNPFIIKTQKVGLPKHYYEQDYGFPNINFCTYKFGTKSDRMNRINKMFYFKDSSSKRKVLKEEHWFKLIL